MYIHVCTPPTHAHTHVHARTWASCLSSECAAAWCDARSSFPPRTCERASWGASAACDTPSCPIDSIDRVRISSCAVGGSLFVSPPPPNTAAAWAYCDEEFSHAGRELARDGEGRRYPPPPPTEVETCGDAASGVVLVVFVFVLGEVSASLRLTTSRGPLRIPNPASARISGPPTAEGAEWSKWGVSRPVGCHTFAKVSTLVHLLHKLTAERAFEKFSLCLPVSTHSGADSFARGGGWPVKPHCRRRASVFITDSQGVHAGRGHVRRRAQPQRQFACSDGRDAGRGGVGHGLDLHMHVLVHVQVHILG